jgi:hypothetical protein
VVAAMSTQWTVARAISHGLVRDHIPFVRTAKGGRARRGPDFPAFWEAVLAGLLLIAAIVLVVTNHKEVREIYIFAAVLVVQSLPFISAVVIAALEATPFNDYVFLRNLRTRTAALLPRRVAAAGTAPVAAPAVAPPPAPAPVAVEAAVRPEPAPAAAEVVPS